MAPVRWSPVQETINWRVFCSTSDCSEIVCFFKSSRRRRSVVRVSGQRPTERVSTSPAMRFGGSLNRKNDQRRKHFDVSRLRHVRRVNRSSLLARGRSRTTAATENMDKNSVVLFQIWISAHTVSDTKTLEKTHDLLFYRGQQSLSLSRESLC